MPNQIIFYYFTILGVTIALFLSDLRLSIRQTCSIAGTFLVVLLSACTLLAQFVNWTFLFYIYPFITHSTFALLLFFISRFRGWRLLFQILSSILFCFFIQHGSMLAFWLSGQQIWVLFLAYGCLTAVVLFFLLRYLRPLYFQIQHELQSGWWLLCLILLAYIVAVFYLIPDLAKNSCYTSTIRFLCTLFMTGVYAIITLLFFTLRQQLENRHNSELFISQLSALESRLADMQSAEEAIRIQRHDLRHRLGTIAGLAHAGDTQAILSYIHTTCDQLEEYRADHWCADPVLDATFSIYSSKAFQNGIRFDAQLAFPQPLPVDAAELSVVFANALDNAIHACTMLPESQRWILCQCINYPQMMIEISNPCAFAPSIDLRRLSPPTSSGHGIGLKSIQSFCRKRGATLACTYKDGVFFLRIAF